jgi:hypothetical protein
MEINWKYKGADFTDDLIGDNYGFVYIITNIANNKKYIGKKLFYSAKTKQVNGKKKKTKVGSNWKTYYGSNDNLIKDVLSLGSENFNREIIHLCKSKGECNYLEAKEQFTRCVLESEEYYNTWIMVRVHNAHIKAYNERNIKGNGERT